jgi:hypothetical protein
MMTYNKILFEPPGQNGLPNRWIFTLISKSTITMSETHRIAQRIPTSEFALGRVAKSGNKSCCNSLYLQC